VDDRGASTKISEARARLIRSRCGLVVKGLLVGAGCAPCPPRVVGRRHHGSFPGKNAPRIFTIPRATINFLRGSVRMPGGGQLRGLWRVLRRTSACAATVSGQREEEEGARSFDLDRTHVMG
jgi:hypothetical protein